MKTFKGKYSLDDLRYAIDNLEGYEIISIEGSLLDDCYLIAPTEESYSFLFKETYSNCWSSCYTVTRYTPKEIQRVLANLKGV